MQTVVVLPRHAKPLWAGHPWVHAAAVAEVRGEVDPDAVDVVHVVDGDGRPIGRGFLSAGSAIRVRLLDRPAEDPPPVEAVLSQRIEAAVLLRRRLFPRPTRTNVFRLVHAEGDGLPGLVVDRLGDVLVAQFATGAMHRRRAFLAQALLEASGAASLVARAGGYEAEEGIDEEVASFAAGSPVAGTVLVREEGMLLEVDPRHGQKTGHYADQRENRCLVAQAVAGAEVLDLFAGTGGFSIQALRHGAARALAVEASEHAGLQARTNAALCGVAAGLETLAADVRAALKDLKRTGRVFDVVVHDPPNFFPRRGGEGNARKAYRDLNVQALTRVRPGGLLATFSCSARLDGAGLQAILASAARECRREVRILRELAAGPDHPVLAAAPEGRYLSGVLAVVAG